MVSDDDDDAFLRQLVYGDVGQEVVVADPPQTEGGRVTPIRRVSPLREIIPVDDEGQGQMEGGSCQREVAGGSCQREVAVDTELRPPVPKRNRPAGATEERALKKKKGKSKSSSQKSGSTGRYRSFALDDEFVQKSYEEYVADPLAAFVHTATHLQDIASGQKKELELQIQGLKDELSTTEVTLARTKNNLKMAVVTLTTFKESERIWNQQRIDLTSERNEARKAVDELTAEVKRLQEAELGLNAKITELEGKLDRAESSVDKNRIAELERALEKANETNKRVARIAMGNKEKGFNLALEQVKVINPSMESMFRVMSHEQAVEEGKIVKVDPVTKEKRIVYPLS